MQQRFIPFVLVAGLAIACRSGGDSSQPTQPEAARSHATPAQSAEPQAAQPMIPILAIPAAPAQATPPAATPISPRAERLAALRSEQAAATVAYYDALKKALGDNENPTTEDWQKAMSTVKEPDSKIYAARAQQLLDEDPSDLTALQTIRWTFENVGEPDTRPKLLALIEKHHMDRPEMADLCARLAPQGLGLLERLVASSPHREVRGLACSAIAEWHTQSVDIAKQLDDEEMNSNTLESMQGWFGADTVEKLRKLDVKETQKEIERLYERIVAEFGDVKLNAGSERETTLGKQASAALYETRNLVVGKSAPEIEGVDLDKVAFRLSDYRGKVVLLDFWGNW